MNLKQDIKQQLTPNELNILAYIETHPVQVTKMSIQELADVVYVSSATIMRLCKKMNLSGYNDLKYQIRQSQSLTKESGNTSLELRGLLSGSLSTLRQMTKEIDSDQFERVLDYLCGDGNLYLFARGLTYMPMNYMYHMLLSVDRACILYIDPPLMYNASLQMGSGDMAVIASSGGATKEILKAAQMVKDSHGFLTVLSSSEKTPLRDMADAFFYCPASKRRFYDVDINSRMTLAFMVELILDGYFNRLGI